MGCVYMATNTITGQKYIGKTVHSLRTRMKWHIAAASRKEGYRFHNALRKYGEDAFQWEVLKESDSDKALCLLEQQYIKLHNSIANGYNLTRGGDGVTGRPVHVVQKIAEFHRGRKRNKETRERISKACKGMQRRLGATLSDETKAKISAALTGRKMPQSQRDKISAYMKGRPKSEEQKRKMSEARKRWWKNRQAVRNLLACRAEAEHSELF